MTAMEFVRLALEIEVSSQLILLVFSEYPRVVRTSRAADVVGLVLTSAMLLWLAHDIGWK